MTWLFVGLGGAAGAMARHTLGSALARRFADVPVPMGTLAVNLLGCLVVGLVAARLAPSTHPRAWGLLVTGFLGGFTTFSAFGLEHVHLLQRGLPAIAMLHAALHVLGGFAAAWTGFLIARPR